MSTVTILRATGEVRRVESKSGSYLDTKTGELKPWAFDNVRILAGGDEFCDLTFDPKRVQSPARGDLIDVAVKASVRPGKGGFGPSLNLDVIGPWTDSE